jgi:S1-C subfamily serine protease
MSTCRGNDVSAGTIPNMGATDVGGLQLSGVREGGPAAKGGLKSGDIVVEFGGRKVKDIYEYTDALCAHKPGETVSVVVNRNGEILTLTVTLGKRGS